LNYQIEIECLAEQQQQMLMLAAEQLWCRLIGSVTPSTSHKREP
jgi:hypothetical protein